MLLAYKSPVKTWLTGRDAFVFAVQGARSEPGLQGVMFLLCIIPAHYTRALYPRIIPAHYTRALYPRSIPAHYTRALYPRIIPAHYTRALHPRIIPAHYYKASTGYPLNYRRCSIGPCRWQLFLSTGTPARFAQLWFPIHKGG